VYIATIEIRIRIRIRDSRHSESAQIEFTSEVLRLSETPAPPSTASWASLGPARAVRPGPGPVAQRQVLTGQRERPTPPALSAAAGLSLSEASSSGSLTEAHSTQH
jgi:hypothetical protein